MGVDRLNITKKIDGLGRVVIPKSVRDKLRIFEGDELEIAIIDGWIGLRKLPIGEGEDKKQIMREILESEDYDADKVFALLKRWKEELRRKSKG
jgi:AbrB family looped-hinge helix DNA binding protein